MNDFLPYLLFIIALAIVYFIIDFFSDFLIKKELNKKTTNRISNTKTYNTITRRDEKHEYEFPFNPNVDGFWIRAFAKILDYIIYLTLFFLIEKFSIEIITYPFLASFLALFFLNPIFESITGTTFGKFICGLRVIDDFGENPSIVICLIKNLLQLSMIVLIITTSISVLEEKMFYHNTKTFTYTIWNKDKDKVLLKLSD